MSKNIRLYLFLSFFFLLLPLLVLAISLRDAGAQFGNNGFVPVVASWPNRPYSDPLEHEPNNAWNQANGALIDGQEYKGRFPSKEDEKDYFFFYQGQSGPVKVQLTEIGSGHNYDMTLRSSDLKVVKHSGELGNKDENIEVRLGPGLYYVQVYNWGKTGSSLSYNLVVDYMLPPPPAPTWTPVPTITPTPTPSATPGSGYPPFLGPEEEEPNDRWNQANGALIAGREYTGRFPSASDVNDYYFFYQEVAGPVDLALTEIGLGHDYDMVLRDKDLELVGYSGQVGNWDEWIDVDVYPGLYYVQVFNRSGTGTTRPYKLVVNYLTTQKQCVPPTENPPDEWHSNRGLVQTDAVCRSTLSAVDRADYYTFKPDSDGPHILHLQNLPQNSEWAAMIFFDNDSPEYAPGDAYDGLCRITESGSGDKQVSCDLEKDLDYFVKVSAGSTPMNGSYEMLIIEN